MAFIPTKPVNTNITMVEGSAFYQKFIPLNPDGTVYDCTGLNTGEIQLLTDAVSAGDLGDQTLTVEVADATGITVSLTPAIVFTMSDLLGTNRGAFALQVGDGTDTLNAAFGNISITKTGLPSA